MRENYENEFFNSDYYRSRHNFDQNQNSHNQYPQNRDYYNPGRYENRSWFGNDEAEYWRRNDEQNRYNYDNGNYYRQHEYYGGSNPSGNYSSAYDRNYGTSSGAHLDEDYFRQSRSGEYDPLRSIYGGPGNSMQGYGHESRRDFTTGNDYNSGRSDYHYNNQQNNRNWAEKTGDEVRSWFGDDEAGRRRNRDEIRDNRDDWSRDKSWHNRERGFSRW